MRFSIIAVSATIFGAAMAVPGSVVYETAVVTITSCAPEKTNCPGRVQPAASPSSPASVPASSAPPGYMPSGNATDVTLGKPSTPAAGVAYPTTKTSASPAPPMGTGYPYVPSGSGMPRPAANTSAPATPSSPSKSFEGAASIKGFSFAAVAVAAAAFVFA